MFLLRFFLLLRVPNSVLVCGHNLCKCPAEKLERPLVDDLKKTMRKRLLVEKVREIVQKKQEESWSLLALLGLMDDGVASVIARESIFSSPNLSRH